MPQTVAKMPMPARELPPALAELLAGMPRMALAFSGGVDSRFLAHAALLCGCSVLALHASGPHIPESESAQAIAWAKKRGIEIISISFNPLAHPHVAQNGRQRCYFCKKMLFEKFMEIAGRRSAISNNEQWLLCDGSQADDQNVWRPGAKALKECNVLSPLALAGMGKAAIRAAARAAGMEDPDQAARPCLLTRLNYGLDADAATLARICKAEAELAAILPEGADFRLRLTPRPILQAAAPVSQLWPDIQASLARNGFENAALMECGHVSGFFDRF